MPKKRPSPIMQKVSSLLDMSIFLAKMRRPITARLKISLKNPRKFKLLKHYNYGYTQEYEYSPASTPLIQHYYHHKKSSTLKMESMFLISRCLGFLRGESEDENRLWNHNSVILDRRLQQSRYSLPLDVPKNETLSCNEDEDLERASWDDDDDDDGENSIDERAEEFIERFYEEMRLQRQESLMN